MKIFIIFIILLLKISETIYAQHVALPPVNLGLTNFLDGQAFPGLLVEQYVEYYDANKLNDSGGNKIPGKNTLHSLSLVTHLAYISHKKFLGGYVGFEVVAPIVYLDINQAMGQKGDKTAFGDITISPLLLQWHNDLFDKPYFHRFAFSVILPTGHYDRKDDVNIGSNVYSLNPYYSFTYFLMPKWSISSRIHYLWNSDNDKPIDIYNASNITPGQAIHFNYATSLEIFDNVRVGFAGYYLKQISPSKIDGNSLINADEEVFSFGPGCYVMTKNRWQLHFNYYHEFISKNRPQGDKLVLRLARAF